MALCRRCGAEIGNAAFCKYCGASASSLPIPKKKSSGLVLFVASLLIIAGVACGVILLIPSEKDFVYHLEVNVEDLVIHCDDNTIYNVLKDGKYYNPDTGEFDLSSPSNKGRVGIKYFSSENSEGLNSDTIEFQFSESKTTPYTGHLASFDCSSDTTFLSVFFVSQDGTYFDAFYLAGLVYGFDVAMTSDTYVLNGNIQPYVTGKMIINVEKIYS